MRIGETTPSLDAGTPVCCYPVYWLLKYDLMMTCLLSDRLINALAFAIAESYKRDIIYVVMQVSEEAPWEHIQEQDIRSAVVNSFLGDIMQVPPMYSAIKVRLDCIAHQNGIFQYFPILKFMLHACILLIDHFTLAHLYHCRFGLKVFLN